MRKRDRALNTLEWCQWQLRDSTEALATMVTSAVERFESGLDITERPVIKHAGLRRFLLRAISREDQRG